MQHVSVYIKPSSGSIRYSRKPTARNSWQYASAVGFLKYRMLPEDGLI
jgi:hypothetical protein